MRATTATTARFLNRAIAGPISGGKFEPVLVGEGGSGRGGVVPVVVG